MDLRNWLNSHPAASLAVVVLVVIGIVWTGRSSGVNQRFLYGYYYDLQTGTLFVHDRTAIAPIASPSGAGEAVLAVVYSCSDCADKPSHFVAWLERYTDDAKQAMLEHRRAAEPGPEDPKYLAVVESGHRMALSADNGAIEWISHESIPATQIRERAIAQRCADAGGAVPRRCDPLAEELP